MIYVLWFYYIYPFKNKIWQDLPYTGPYSKLEKQIITYKSNAYLICILSKDKV
jgi:hypothetical protein